MEMVLDLQGLEAADAPSGKDGGGDGGAGSNLSLLASCANSTVSLLTCH
ncbi:SapB/AmfS family lanthipeptide [Saccharomonospora iraqiensis]|nr:SapB/AmfS family lanthipeptide [Saccharomonospora iraqiensis]